MPDNEDLLKEAVLDSYMNILSDTAIQGANERRPTRGRGSGGFSGALQDEINLSAPVVNDALAFSQMGSQNVPANQREAKTVQLLFFIKLIVPTRSTPYVSRGQFYNMYLDGLDLDDSEETRNKFKNAYGDSQIFKLNTRDYSLTSPVMINTDSPEDLYKFYLKNTGLSEKATNYHLGQYNSYINSINTNNQTNESSQNTGGGSTSKYNKK